MFTKLLNWVHEVDLCALSIREPSDVHEAACTHDLVVLRSSANHKTVLYVQSHAQAICACRFKVFKCV